MKSGTPDRIMIEEIGGMLNPNMCSVRYKTKLARLKDHESQFDESFLKFKASWYVMPLHWD